ncbi:fibronectin type III domain-containing protein [Vibrio diabolicus]|uniref:fibronectin type III domain-containing protein n=1 Tax=Vibrio diabolicus TaxID=50719 RepID=UPI00215FEE77|nr:fibronectin type III domain-containing protein [Vibrio diabolicus]MCS0364966.1 fibronectin type III domain-containing protein [Vibrio diabolicus]
MGLAAATVAWISVGLSVGATIYTMTQMPDNKSNDSIAGTKVTKNGTQSPRNRVYGTAIVGCTYVYSNVLDRDQSYRLDVFSVGGVGAVRFHNVWIDDVKMFDEDKNDLTDPANASSGIYDSSSMRPRYKKSDGFKMQWRSGQENQVAAKLAIDNSDGEWTVNHRGACVPHIVIYADYSTNQDYVFFSDRYNINALVTGAEVFDPRTGQVNGESSNTALATLDFLMNDYYGMGVTVDYINMESFKYGATFCEDNDLRINSAIDASAKFADILQDMLACCGGALAIVDGKITFLVEEKVLAPVYELNEDNILKNSLKVSPADSSSYYNVVSTTFKSEINRDNDDDFVIPQNAASDPRVMADGKIITKSLKMPYARDAYEAEDGVVQHCVKYMTNLVYNKAKFQMSCSFDIDLHKFSELRPWDVIGVSSEIYGFKNKLFRVQSMKVATDADRFNIATIHCIEYDHSVYEGTVEGTGSLPRPKPDDNVPAPKNVMFTLSSFVNTGYGLLAWEASCFTPSTAYDIEYKLSSASKWTRLTSAFRGTQFTLTDLKEARYDFRVRTYELFLGSSDWTTITNINVRPAYVIPEVTGLKVETSTPNFKFTWDDMTNVEVDNIPSSDAPNSAGSTGKLADVFHQYSIQIVVNGVMKYATTTKESTFTLDLEKNKEMMGGQPSRVITFRISIEDRLGNSSLVTELVANNRQIGVAGDVDVTNANGSATVEWSPCFEPDFAGTEVHISTTKGFTPSASTLHATLGKESFYVFPFPDKTTRYMRIAHFDTMGRDGLQYSPEITLTYDGVESAKSVRLISDSQTFHVNKSGVAAPSLIIMSAFTQNVEGSVKWTTSPSVALATTSNPNERVLKYASMGNHDSVKVTVTVDGVTDTVTICKVRDGHDGQDGQDGQDGSNGQDGNTIYEEYRYGQVINPDASWTAWGADMRTSDIYRQTRRVINDVPQAAGRVHRIAGMDGSNGADGERLFVVYHKNPVNQRPMPPEGAGNTGGWTEDSDGANWMSQKLANTIDQPLTFWSFPIQMKGNDGEVDYSHVDEIAEAKKNEAIEASIASATASVEAAEVRAKAYADGVATDAEKAAIAAADAKANAAETKAKAYADGVVTEAEQAAIAEAERLAAQAEANAKAASDPKGSASKAQQAAIAAAEEKANAAKVFAQSYADGVANDAEQAAILAAQAKADAAETKAKAYADGEITKAEQAAIDEAERLAAQAEANAKALAQGVGAYREVTFGFSPTEGGSYHSLSGLQYYTVSETVLLKSCVVNASKEGTVTICLYKGHGKATDKLVAQKEVTLTKGVQRIELGFVFDKAVSTTWTLMRDGDVPLYRHIGANTVTYPREAGSLVTPQSSAGSDMAYYYFYNLEVAGLGVEGTPIGADAVGSAAAAKEAAEAYALAKANLAETKAKAYADGVVTEAEQAAIDEAERLAAAAQENAKIAAEESTGRWSRDYMVNATKFAEVLDIKGASLPTQIGGTAGYSRYLVTLTTLGTGTRTEYAAWLRFDSAQWVVTTIKASGTSSNHPVLFIQDNKPYIKTYHEKEYRVRCTVEDQYVSAASAISQSAKEYADATANAAEVKAKAYADGIVTESEQAAIEAAEAAARAAEERAKAYADGEVTKAEQAAIEAAQEAANLAETKAKAYADGVSTEAELAAIAAAEAKAKAAEVAAKAYADGEVTKAEQAAIDEAERLADEAKAHADAELKKERKRQFDPHLTDPLKTFSKVYSGSPDVISTLEGVGNISVVSGVTGGNALSLTGDHWIYSTAVIPVDPNKKYKMVVKVRQTKDKTAGGSGFYAGVATLDRNYNNLTGGAGNHRYFCAQSQTLTVAGGWRTFEGYIQGIGDNHNNFRSGTAYVRPMFIVNYSGGNGIAEVDEIRFYEVTERGDLVDLGFETTQGAQDKANAAKAAAEAYAKARAEAALNTQFVHSGFIERDGLNFRKKSGTSQWDGWASSKQTFTGGCSLTFTAGTTNAAAMCGITTPNMGGAGYNDIDFCFYIRSNGTLAIYENGKRIADYGNYTVGTVLTIRYDGIRVRYFVNGVLKREVGTSANLGFVADMSIYDVSTGFPIQGLTFIDSEGAAAWAKDSLDNRIPQANADALKTMMSNEGLRYYRKITVGGEANKYYPVIIHGGDQNKLRTIKIWRSYAETAPNSWNTATHKGALMMTWQGNFGGWGGAVYRSTLLEHSEAYSDILADCYIVNHSMGFAFFLRGGGAVYHIASDMDISGVERTNPSGGGSGIYLDGTLNSYVHATSPYNAPDALTAVNRDRLTNIKTAYNGQGQHIKNLNADNITAGKIAAQYVHADVYNGTLVNATNIKAGMLDADHINTRTFTGENAIFDAEVYGGILTGAVVRTGSTGARAEMREDGYKFAAYNAQNKPTFYVDANGNVVMNSGSISSNVLSEASRNSNIVTWIGTAGKGGNMQFTDNLVLQNDVTYFPITNNFYTTGKNGVLNVQYCAAQGYLFQDEKSAVGAAAPAQKTLPADAAPTVYFVDASNTTKGAVIRMTIKYTTQAANGTAPSKTNPSGTQGWRKTYAHFHIDNIATRPNVATATNVKGYKLCINLGASSIKTALKALKRVPDTISYHEDSEGGRYLPHSYKVVWSGNAAAVTNSWGEGLYYIIGTQRSDWRNCGFVMVTDENHHSPQHRSIYGQYDAYYEYRYDTKQFKASKTHIAVIIKLSGV